MSKPDKPDMRVEAKQVKQAKLDEAIERWMRKLLRAAHELEKLRAQRKRLVGTRRPTAIRYRNIADIPPMAGGGDDFNDDIPL